MHKSRKSHQGRKLGQFRLARGVALTLAALAAVPFSASLYSATLGDAQWIEQPLEIIVDGVSYGATMTCTPKDRKGDEGIYFIETDFFTRVAMRQAAPEAVPAECGGHTFVKAASVSFTYDRTNARLLGKFDPGAGLQTTTVVPTEAKALELAPLSHAPVLNYGAYTTRSSFTTNTVVDLEAQAFTELGQITASRQDTLSPQQNTSRWTNVLLRRDFFDQRLSMALGRQATAGATTVLDLGSTQFDGLMISKRVTDEQDRALSVQPSVRGFMKQPGTVTIRQNDQIVRVVNFPAGPFELSDPALVANRPAQLDMRAEDGSLMDSTTVFVSGSLGLLRPDAMEWRLSAGRETTAGGASLSLSSSSSSQNSGFGLGGDLRYGITQTLSMEAVGRISRNYGLAVGVAAVRDLDRLGVVSVGLAMQSETPEMKDTLRPTVVAAYRFNQDWLSLDYRVSNRRAAWGSGGTGTGFSQYGGAGVNFDVGPGRFSGTFNWNSTSGGPEGSATSSRSVSGVYFWRLFGKLPVSVYASRSWASQGTSAGTQIGMSLSTSLAVWGGTVTSDFAFKPRGSTAQESYSTPIGSYATGRLSTTLPGPSQSTAGISWDNYASQGWASLGTGPSGDSRSASARGAIVLVDGYAIPANYSNGEGMAIVRLPELPNVSLVSQGSTRVVARTNEVGTAAIVNVQPYTPQNYTVLGEDLPEKLKLPASLVPKAIQKWGTGNFVPGVRRVTPGHVRLVDAAGHPLMVTSLIGADTSADATVLAVVGDNGMAPIDDLGDLPAEFDVFLAPGFGKTCHVKVTGDRAVLYAEGAPVRDLKCVLSR